jgi:hypothetical protein
VQDNDLHERFTDNLFAEAGFDLRGQKFDPFYVAELTGASSVEFVDGQLTITVWKPGDGERVARKT